MERVTSGLEGVNMAVRGAPCELGLELGGTAVCNAWTGFAWSEGEPLKYVGYFETDEEAPKNVPAFGDTGG